MDVGIANSIVLPNLFRGQSPQTTNSTLATPTGLAVGFGPRVTLAALFEPHSPLTNGSPALPISRAIRRLALQPREQCTTDLSAIQARFAKATFNRFWLRPVDLAEMSILVDKNTKVIVCGMTGREGGFHTQQMIDYGTQVVAGVTPGKGGTSHLGVPVFDTVEEAVAATGANASLIFVPAPFAADSVLECEDAGVPFITLITEGLPVQDSVRITNRIRSNGRSRLLGGNCAGIITPGECKMGIMPGHIFKPGPVGMVSRSGTLTYEIVWELTRADLGQTTCVGIGGDPVPGTRFIETLEMFEKDEATKAVVMIGEIGGSDEETAAQYIKQMSKPVVGFISGRTAPPGKRMGHAGAIVSGKTGTAQSKVDALEAAGAPVADRTSDVARLVREALDRTYAGV